VKKPAAHLGKFIDIYYEQFSELSDEPTITINNDNSCYEIPYCASYKDIKHEIKRIKADAAWLLKAAHYLENKFRGDL
jgi:hypothetical protein